MIAYIFADTRNVILVLLGPQWLEATPFVRLMCVAAFFGSLARITNWFYLSRGETGRQLRWALFAQTPGMLAAVLLGARWGALGVAAGFTIATSALAIPAVFYCLRGTPVRPRDFARAAARPVLGAAGAAALLLLTTCLLPHTGVAPLDMGLRLALFLAFYGFAWLASPGGRREAVEAIAMLQELRGRPGPPA
jgi:PST family polysaccharide transporter